MRDIVARMRCRTLMWNRGNGDVRDVPDEDCLEAADKIERLRAENARLREALLATLSTTVHLCNALDVDMEETFIRVKNSKSGDVLAKRSVADIVQAGCDILGEEERGCPTSTIK